MGDDEFRVQWGSIFDFVSPFAQVFSGIFQGTEFLYILDGAGHTGAQIKDILRAAEIEFSWAVVIEDNVPQLMVKDPEAAGVALAKHGIITNHTPAFATAVPQEKAQESAPDPVAHIGGVLDTMFGTSE